MSHGRDSFSIHAMKATRPIRLVLALALPLALSLGCAMTSDPLAFRAAPRRADAILVTSGTLVGELPSLVPIPDPLERYNRSMRGVNNFILRWVIRPVVKTLRYVFYPEVVRKRIGMIGRNLAWPVRLFGNLLQGEWAHAGGETSRFLINSTVGIVGIFDPAGSWGLKPHPEDFGQAFGRWGFDHGYYFELPMFGPASGRDAVGTLFDTAANPVSYATGLGLFFDSIGMTFSIDQLLRQNRIQSDPYAFSRDLWALVRESQVKDFQITTTGTTTEATLAATFLQVHDPRFFNQAHQRRVRLNSTDRRLPYSCWIQRKPAPLIYILPGTGSHRLSAPAVALAESAWRNGFSVVTISSTFNWEFMKYAGVEPVPGFPPDDARDVYTALDAIDRQLRDKYGNERFTSRGLLGVSLGGLHALLIDGIAADAPPDGFHPDRVVAVCPPIDLEYALRRLDQYYNAPLRWTDDERLQRMDAAVLKALMLAQGLLDPRENVPFDDTEAQYLIGLSFRLILREAIYHSQRRENQGILQSSLSRFSRRRAYGEISRYSYIDYLERFVIPHYNKRRPDDAARAGFSNGARLRSYEAALAADDRLRVIANADDFLMRPADREWLVQTLGDRAIVLPGGGHIGNLYLPQVQSLIMNALVDRP
jgi:ABC-type transporter lipoprotein component MlaA